jgi:hypothetical protein
MTSIYNSIFMQLTRRAEGSDRQKLVETFVNAGPLFQILSSPDHQIIYGRRGTGKTHCLLYLAEDRARQGDLPLYLDMRTIGSNGGIYGDPTMSLIARGTHLLIDTLGEVHNQLLNYAIDDSNGIDLSRAGPILDKLANAISEVRIVGSVEVTTSSESSSTKKEGLDVGASIGTSGAEVRASLTDSSDSSNAISSARKRSGQEQYSINFGNIHRHLVELGELVPTKRTWLLLDEWSALPADVQPFLADMLRRCVFPIPKAYTVKIAAIEFRSVFQISGQKGGYIGIELGADAQADLNLDDFLVFDADAERARSFFKEFLFKHFRALADKVPELQLPASADALISLAFTQKNAFDEFVRSAEGVPRDAINLISLAAQLANDRQISIPIVRQASQNWYQRDKQPPVGADLDAQRLLHWIVDEVIRERKARAFLLAANSRDPLIDRLFDARVIHVLKRNVAAKDAAGERFTAYKLDYGCYVDLIATANETKGAFEIVSADGKAASYLDVPPDDYRSIRRAILNLDQFKATKAEIPAQSASEQ